MILPPAFDLARRAMARAESGGDDDLQERLGTFFFWAVALDERMGDLNGGDYRGQRGGHPGGRLLLPARFARNALAHGSVVAARAAGFSVPFTLPLTIPPATWRPLGDLQAEWPDRQNPGGKAEVAYGELLAGMPVGEFMPLVRGWFDLHGQIR